MKRIFGQMLLFSLFTLTFGVYATQLTWDVVSNGPTIDDGAGTWKVGVSTFNDGATSVVWATGSDVVVGNGGEGGMITISGTVIPNSILFLPVSSNYTLSGGIIKLPNANTTITASGATSPIINSVITGTGGLLKLGAGTLTLGGTNTYTGDTIISEGTVIATNANAFGLTGSISVADGATLDISALNFSGQDNIVSRTTVVNGGILTTTIQTVTYDFESDTVGTSPANMTIEYSGLMKIGTIAGINGNGTYLYTNSGAQYPISSLLTKFPAANDYSITWLESSSGTNYKDGILLRAQPTPYYKGVYTGVRLGYVFQVTNTGMTIWKVLTGSLAQLGTTAIPARSLYTPYWYKASVVGSGLNFYYSDISNKGPWNLALYRTDAAYTGGYTQYTASWGSIGPRTLYVDEIIMQYQTSTLVVPDFLKAPSPVLIGDTRAAFNFTGNSGQADRYRLTANPGGIVATGISSPLTLSGLLPGTTYVFTVAAHNAAGYSIESNLYTGTTKLNGIISYSTTGATSGDVIATLTGLSGATITNNGGSNTYTFTGNGTFTFTFSGAENTGSAVATVIWIDKDIPTATINYSTISPTTGDVNVVLTGFNEPVIITNNGGGTGYLFTGNGSFIFDYIDAVGNTGSTTAIVNNIDRIPPTGIIHYSTTGFTNGDVVATLTGLNEPVTIINNGGSYIYTFTGDGSFVLDYVDAAGNTGSTTATVTWIDKTGIYGTINYSTTGITNNNVIATIVLNKTGTITNNSGSTSYTFTGNGSFSFNYIDEIGNTGSTIATVNNIDKIVPIGTITYSTISATTGSVIAMLTGLNKNITVTNNSGSSSYLFTGNGDFTFNFIDAAGNTGTITATVSWIYTPMFISVNTPVQYQVFQRTISTNKGDIIIVGSYTGTNSSIEASWDGSSFQDISAVMSGGIFTGTLVNQNGGQGTLLVRASNNSGVNSSISDVGVGDIFVVGGQSNAVGHGHSNQIYTGTNGIKSILFGNDYTWKQLTDPYDNCIGQIDNVSNDCAFAPAGSFVPILATKIVASQSIPVAFIPTAKGGTMIHQWQPSSTGHFNRNTLYGSQAYRIAQVGGKIAGVIWFQGESDALWGRSYADYQSLMNTMINTLQSDFSGTGPIKFFMGSIGDDYYTGSYVDKIRKAQQELYQTNANVYPDTALTYDINLSDEGSDHLHFESNGDLSGHADRFWNVIARNYYGLPLAPAPRAINTGIILYTNTNTLVVPFNTALATQAPQAYTDNLSGITYLTGSTGAFGLSGSNTNLSVVSVSLSGTNTVVLSLTGDTLGSGLFLNYANAMLGVNKAIYSSGTYQPAYPIYSAPITIIDNSVPIISLNGSGTLVIAQGISYTDSGASWTDNFDGNGSILVGSWGVTGSFAVSGFVNTNVPATYYIQYNKVDNAGNTTTAIRTVIVVDSTPIGGTIAYSTTGTTSGNVIATITLNKTGTITNNSGSTSYTFTGNGVFTFNFVDQLGLTGSATATVNNIDKSGISGTIAYSTTGTTSGNVIATITLNKTGTITNNGGSTSYVFTGNGSFTFTYIDQAGNTGGTIATVNNIDKVAPTGVISYSTTGATNGNVIATLTGLNESVTVMNNSGSFSYAFTGNGSFAFTYIDQAGNTGSTVATVNNIDNTPLPLIDVTIHTGSSTSAFTGGAIVLTGTTATGATFGWTGEIIVYAKDSVDNSLSFATSGTSILASGRDSTLSAPIITTDTGMAQFGEVGVPSQDSSTMTRQIVATLKAGSDISSLYITGAYFKISYKVDAGISGNILKIIRSEDGNVRESNTPDAQCILDSNKICTFYTDRLSYFATIKETLKQTNSGGGGGGGGGSSSTTTNPTTTVNTGTNNLTGAIVSNNSGNINTTGIILSDYIPAYNWAFENGITTKPTIQEAKIDKPISRAEMAKMISQYAVNVEYKIPNPGQECNFKDIAKVTPDLIPYIKEVCQLGIMGRNSDGTVSPNFNPYGLVTRAQFATLLSRVLYGNTYDTTKGNYRDKHMQVLYNKGIIKSMNPLIHEQRGWIFLMLYRSSK